MDNFTIIWLMDVIGTPLLLAIFVLLIGVVSVVWTLAIKTFKKFPWRYLWIFTVSFCVAVRAAWQEFPRVWLREFKDRKEKWRSE